MASKKKRKATTDAEYHLHQHLWIYARELFELSGNSGGSADALECSSLLLTAFAVEAYTNRLLEVGCLDIYRDERKFFSSGEYRGTPGKLRFLARKLGVDVDLGARPFQSISALFDWRDDIVHARVERLKKLKPYTDPNQLQPPESEVLGFPIQSGSRIKIDTEEFCNSLQAAAMAARWKAIFVDRAFTGFLGLRGVSL